LAGCANQRTAHRSIQMRRPLVIFMNVGYADIAGANIGWNSLQNLFNNNLHIPVLFLNISFN
jgi:hypothetical protein